MNRFVLLYHEMPSEAARASHWDLMLERNGNLQTWALDTLPQLDQAIRAVRLPDHRLHYLDYEGPVSGDRGTVRRIDRGDYTVLREDVDRVQCEIRGKRFVGTINLARSVDDPQRWIVSFCSP